MIGCAKCGGRTRRCVWNGRTARIMECLTCGFQWTKSHNRFGLSTQQSKSGEGQ
jgi:Zn ribbon nucleic-acid-binding protein